MKGTIASFRRGLKTQTMNQIIIVIDGITSKEQASKLIGKEVTWKSPAGKQLKGKISAVHGSKGAVRAIFSTGMPGQSLGTEVNII